MKQTKVLLCADATLKSSKVERFAAGAAHELDCTPIPLILNNIKHPHPMVPYCGFIPYIHQLLAMGGFEASAALHKLSMPVLVQKRKGWGEVVLLWRRLECNVSNWVENGRNIGSLKFDGALYTLSCWRCHEMSRKMS